ncbi:hypothetical protein UCREL1_9762 [Eutypa lata UCREL1]|uniref:Uncharacterized protein n=1 Tax=Eutypa lata (strain UCR-EL1) TaxID=1287681 RepID=M7T0H1_EUTLA|nr:hypothetical protein UCREL1_9762 [Eutypa lata UCREL1]
MILHGIALPATVYTGPLPSFHSPAPDLEGEEDGLAASPSVASAPPKAADARAKPDGVPSLHDGLLAASSRPSSSGSSSGTPIGRFRRDEQTYEKLALQLSAANAAAAASSSLSTTPPRHDSTLLPGEGILLAAREFQPGDDEGDVDMMTRSGIPFPRRSRRPGDIPLPSSASRLPRSVLVPPTTARTPVEELREMTRFMKSAEWETLGSEEQTKYIHEVFLLRRRVRAVELPRESKSVRVRKRQRVHSGEKTDESGSGSSFLS